MSKLLLIDGNSLMFRSYYATAYTGNLMKTKEGIYTNSLFGFVNMMSKLVDVTSEKAQEQYVFVAFDAGKQTFRHKQYKEYKGTRKPLPEELKVQIPLIKEYLDIIKVKRLESLDYEADDLIGIAAKRFEDDFDSVEIITGDHDLLQLVDEKISVSLTKKGVGELDTYTTHNFYEKMNFYPNQLVEYKGIVGDTSDNLIGIKGIGDKTAIKLLNEYKTIEGIYENRNKLTNKLNTLFDSCINDAITTRFLATIITSSDIELTKEEMRVGKINLQELISFFNKVEFNSIVKKLKESNLNKPKDLDVINISNDYQNLTGESYIIYEVFGSNYIKGTFLGIGIYSNNTYYFVKGEELYLIKDYLENPDYKKYTFDFKGLYYLLYKQGIKITGVIFDLLLASYLINPDYSNDDFLLTISNFKSCDLPYYDNIYGSNSKMKIPSSDIYINYCLNKAKELSTVKKEVFTQLIENDLEYLFDVEMNLSIVLSKMEFNGLKVDTKRLKELGEEFNLKVGELEQLIYEEAKHTFNINSPKQLGEVLFEELKLPHGKKNKNGYSTSVDVLEKLAKDYKIVSNILEYRAYTKLISTYVNGLLDVTKNEFIHPLYKQALTSTGRLSSVEPNIQNMPIRTEKGQRIREVFISRFLDGEILTVDYSQIELRVLAHISNDSNMVESFINGVDIHAQTASKIYEVNLDEVTKEMRRCAKAINFGIIYGMSPWGLSEALELSPIEANIFINKYFYNFHKAKDTLDNFILEARDLGYSKTIFNRRRYIPQLNEKNQNLKSFGERTAMNSPVQGSAADIIKIAMNKVNHELDSRNLKTILIAQVHDELVFDVPNDEIEIVKEIVKDTMENAVKLIVPLSCGIEHGKNWFLAK